MHKYQSLLKTILIVLFLGLLSYALIYYISPAQVVDAYVFPMTLTVQSEGSAGFDLNTTTITFGTLKRGDSSSRFFDVNNTASFPVKVMISTKGMLYRWVSVSPNDFVLASKEARKGISVVVSVPYDAMPGSYKGELRALMVKA